MKKFTVINEAFICTNCGTQNSALSGGCRNHCKECLFSLHLDAKNPGDRQSCCHGLMKPMSLDQNGKKGFVIYHKCQKCGKIITNKAASDDNFEELIKLSQDELPRNSKI